MRALMELSAGDLLRIAHACACTAAAHDGLCPYWVLDN
eukprot:gene7773-1334_t